MKLNTLDVVALVLVIVGGLNWLFVALGFNLVTLVVGFSPMYTTTVDTLRSAQTQADNHSR